MSLRPARAAALGRFPQLVENALSPAADLVHQTLAEAGVDQLERGFAAAALVQRERRFELVQLLADQPVQLGRVAVHRLGAVAADEVAQAGERVIDLGQRSVVGLEVGRIARQQEPALSRFGLADQRQRLVDGSFHFERGRHGPIGVLEPPVTDLGESEHAEGNDDPQCQGQEHAQGQESFHSDTSWLCRLYTPGAPRRSDGCPRLSDARIGGGPIPGFVSDA